MKFASVRPRGSRFVNWAGPTTSRRTRSVGSDDCIFFSTTELWEESTVRDQQTKPEKETMARPVQGLIGTTGSRTPSPADAPEVPIPEDRASRFVWGPDDVEHH